MDTNKITLEEFDKFTGSILHSPEIQWADDSLYDSIRDLLNKMRERLYAEELNVQVEKALLKKLLAKYGEEK